MSYPVNKPQICTKRYLSKEECNRIRFTCSLAIDFKYESIIKVHQACTKTATDMRPIDPNRNKDSATNRVT